MISAYAYQNTDDEVIKSSSGGAYRRICKTIAKAYPERKIIYYGAAWQENMSCAIIRETDQAIAFNKFSGSKYVRASIEGIYKSVAEDLKQGNIVVYSGTPCQIFGLNSYVSKVNENLYSYLYTIDIICHGTPSPEIWSDAVNWMVRKERSSVISASFRDKRGGWKSYTSSIKFENGREWFDSYKSQLYVRMFFSHLIFTKGCFNCRFKTMDRVSDFTIGDYWGVEESFPDFPPKEGVSLIIANTEKSQTVIDLISDSLSNKERLEKCSNLKFMDAQPNLKEPTPVPEEYSAFWNDYREKGFEYIIKKYHFYDFYSYARYMKGKLKQKIIKQ